MTDSFHAFIVVIAVICRARYAAVTQSDATIKSAMIATTLLCRLHHQNRRYQEHTYHSNQENRFNVYTFSEI